MATTSSPIPGTMRWKSLPRVSRSGDELIGKCVYTSLVHFDGLYYVNTELYPKNKGVYTKWAKTV